MATYKAGYQAFDKAIRRLVQWSRPKQGCKFAPTGKPAHFELQFKTCNKTVYTLEVRTSSRKRIV